MQPVVASTEAEREQSRTLINKVFPIYQSILKKDQNLITIERRDIELSGENKELLILTDQNKVVGTILLQLAPDAAYACYLTKDPSLPKGTGKIMMAYAEDRARDVYQKNKMRLSTVYHPKCMQQKLEEHYSDQGYRFFMVCSPTEEQQQSWENKFRKEARFRYFEKDFI